MKVFQSSLAILRNILSDRVKTIRIHKVSCSDGIVGANFVWRVCFVHRVKSIFRLLIVIVIGTSHWGCHLFIRST